MAPIDPSQLLKALDTLLSPDGGIRSSEEVTRLASLMKKFSKKLVSRCVYCNVLQATKPEILSDYLDKGGWETINQWLQDAKNSDCDSFLLEMLRLCKLLPMTVSRLKENNTAKLIKSLTKHDNSSVKSISSELVTKWMAIITGAKNSEISDKKKKKLKSLKNEKVEKPVTKTQSDSPKSPGRLKSSKRNSSEKDVKKVEDYYEDVKLDPEPLLPVPKKPRVDRPKTAKLYQKKFRATGLEEETPLPKSISKKSPTVNKNAAVVAAKKEVVKMMNSPVPERITEKKIKPENLLSINENSNPSKGIKLIPAKPRPAHILHESASFMDALISQPVAPPVKKKKKAQPAKPVTSPTSPTITAPKLQFYKDTLEMNEESENKKEDSSELPPEEEKSSSPSQNTEEPMDTSNAEEGGQTPPNEDSTSISSTLNETAEETKENEKTFDPTQLRSILAHGRRRGRKKSVKWVEDSNLKEVFYFEMDETERVNVLRTQNFCDMKSIEVKREREQFELAKRHAGDKMEETIPWWVIPILIDIPPPLVEPGFQSKEREIQKIRHQSTLQEIYFTREMVPESPHEPDLEIIAPQEPKIIPLDEENATGTLTDYSSFEMAVKPCLPEVLTSLMKIPNTRLNPQPVENIPQDQMPVDCNLMSPAIHNTNVNPLNQQLNPHNQPHPMASPYDPGEPVSMQPPNSPGMMGMPPMQNMYNRHPGPDPENLASSDWRTLEMIQQQEQQQQQYFGFPMNQGMMGDPMPGMNMNMNMNMNMRPRIMQDMYRPGMHKGMGPMPMGMGPMRGRGIPRVPCRHFSVGSCRFGIKCSFLHPGINGPPL